MADHDPLALLTVEDLESLLQVKKSWIYDEVAAGRLKAVRLGRQLRFRRGVIEQLLEASEAA